MWASPQSRFGLDNQVKDWADHAKTNSGKKNPFTVATSLTAEQMKKAHYFPRN